MKSINWLTVLDTDILINGLNDSFSTKGIPTKMMSKTL